MKWEGLHDVRTLSNIRSGKRSTGACTKFGGDENSMSLVRSEARAEGHELAKQSVFWGCIMQLTLFLHLFLSPADFSVNHIVSTVCSCNHDCGKEKRSREEIWNMLMKRNDVGIISRSDTKEMDAPMHGVRIVHFV